MPSVESIISDIQTLGTAGQEELLNYLEEVIVLGSYATEVTNEVKEKDSQRGRSAHAVDTKRYQEMANLMVSRDIFVNPAEKPLLTLRFRQDTIVKKILGNGYNMRSA